MQFPPYPTNFHTSSQGVLNQVAEAVGALLMPSPALYYICNQDRLQQHRDQLADLEARIEQTRTLGFSAATRLLLLAPLPATHSDPYVDVVTTSMGGPS